MTTTPDTTRRTLAQAKRMPQWQRLITTVHKAQEAQGYEGHEFGAAEMKHFDATLIGRPVTTVVLSSSTKEEFECYWVERASFEHSDRTCSITYRLKAVYGTDLATVVKVDASEIMHNPTTEEDQATALEFVRRARTLAGRWS